MKTIKRRGEIQTMVMQLAFNTLSKPLIVSNQIVKHVTPNLNKEKKSLRGFMILLGGKFSLFGENHLL